MASSNTVQFRGKAIVLQAFENRNCAAWSLWVGKQFLFKHAGKTNAEAIEVLETHLDLLHENGSTAIYTLRVYDDITEVKQIKEKTESDGSFNFRLQELEPYEPGQRSNALLSRIAALENKLSEGQKDEDEEEPGFLGQVNDALQNPIVGALVKRIFGFELPQASQAGPVAIAGIEDANQDELLQKAIAILKTKEPKLGTHLYKLAMIAEKNINNFNYLISLLDQVTL